MMLWLHSVSVRSSSSFPWLWDLSIPVLSQLPGEHTGPAAIVVLGTSQTHKQSVHPGTHSLLGWEMHTLSTCACTCIKVQCLEQGCSATPQQVRSLDPKWWAVATSPWCPACVWSMYSDIGTLRVVTARKLALDGSCMSHSMSVKWHHHLCGHASHKR